MDSQATLTLTLGSATLILAAATGHLFTQAMHEASHGSFRKALVIVGASAPMALATMLAGTFTLAKGVGLG